MEGDTCIISLKTGAVNISIHALRVEGDKDIVDANNAQLISIHALRVEGDRASSLGTSASKLFLSTPSGWRATCAGEGDGSKRTDFYPRPPGGGRLSTRNSVIKFCIFLSTPSGWRATADQHDFRDVSRISIHALRVEGDRQIGVDVEKWTAISIHALRVEGDGEFVEADI